jgi:hypothetical protein
LKLKCDEPLSNVAFNFNVRRYIEGVKPGDARPPRAWETTAHALHVATHAPRSRQLSHSGGADDDDADDDPDDSSQHGHSPGQGHDQSEPPPPLSLGLRGNSNCDIDTSRDRDNISETNNFHYLSLKGEVCLRVLNILHTVGRCRLNPVEYGVERDWFQCLKPKYDDLLSKFCF